MKPPFFGEHVEFIILFSFTKEKGRCNSEELQRPHHKNRF